MKRIYLIFLTLAFSGCSTNIDFTSGSRVSGDTPRQNAVEEHTWSTMVGKWYGKQPRHDGGTHEWLTTRYEDGTYEIVFRSTDPYGTVERTVETGLWGVSGNVYYTIFEGWIRGGLFVSTDLEGQYTRDAYKIISLTESEMKYRSIENGAIFKIRRVPEIFEL